MSKIQQWLADPGRDYQDGLRLYHQMKKTAKHDNFLNVQNPGKLQWSILTTQLQRMAYVEKHNPLPEEKPLATEAVKHQVKVKEIKGSKKMVNPPVEKIETGERMGAEEIRLTKPILNKLLVMDWKNLSFEEKKVFFNDQTLFSSKKTLMLRNGDIQQMMVSLHAKVKAMTADEQKAERAETMEKIAVLEDEKEQNWKVIDDFSKAEGEREKEPVVVDLSGKDALERDRMIRINKVYIYKNELLLSKMPDKTENDRSRRQTKQNEIDKRKQELRALGVEVK
jgi:hypothetical protein